MNTIRNVEIFKTGRWNNDDYTTQDLDDMVTAHREIDFKPGIKIGHSKDAPGAPAYGYIERLRRVGNKLVADFTSMHDSVVKAIRDRRYSRVSAEVYFNLKRGGRTFRRALKAVALLGAEVPAVAGLLPLHKMEFADLGLGLEVHAYTLPFDNRDDAGDEVDSRVREYREDHPGTSYSDGLSAVLKDDSALRREYAGISLTPEEADSQRWRNALGLPNPQERMEAGIEIQKLVIAAIAKNPLLSNMQALKLVLQQNPDLAEAYRQGHGSFVPSYDSVIGS